MNGLVKTLSLRKVTPDEWRERCLALPCPQRFAVARVVWWEYFGDRLHGQRWAHLDDLIERTDMVTDAVLAAGLVAVGWSPDRAARRAAGDDRSRNPIGPPRHRKGEVRKFGTFRKAKGRGK
jgi:hypothetical protein